MKVKIEHERVSRQVFIYEADDMYRLARADAQRSATWAPIPPGCRERITVEWGDNVTIRVVREFIAPESGPAPEQE